jgi:putative salt-induced outer membrane protein YdiY
LVEGKLTLKTEYSGPIEIQVGKIKQIFTDNPVEVHLKTGEILKGKLKTLEDGKLAVEPSAERQATTTELQSMASINPPPKPKWNGSLTVGASSQSGNTDLKNVSIGAGFNRRTDDDRFTASYLFNYAEQDKKMTVRNNYGAGEYDYFFTKKWYGLLALELYNDTFQDLSLRTTAGAGAGYQVWEDAIKGLAFTAGISYVNENRKVGEDQSWVAGRLGADFRYNILDFVTFTEKALLYPPLESGKGYLFRNDASLVKPLGSRWALKLQNIFLRNSKPAPGFDKDDVYWIFGLQFVY